MNEEARLEEEPGGLAPRTHGWFVVNVAQARWRESPRFGAWCAFEGEGAARFGQLGLNISVLRPGQPACLYHRENQQEDFLVLHGECLVVVAGRERRLRAWDFVHCPPGTDHVFIGAGDGPCAILMVGARLGQEEIVYPLDERARSHGAAAERETPSPAEAYAGTPPSVPIEMRWPLESQ